LFQPQQQGFQQPQVMFQIKEAFGQDFKHHNRIQLKTHHHKWICAESRDQNFAIVANRDEAREWETFHLEHLGNNRVALRTHHGRYMCAEPSGYVIGNRENRGEWEAWVLERIEGDRVALRSHHGRYLRATHDGRVHTEHGHIKECETFRAVHP